MRKMQRSSLTEQATEAIIELIEERQLRDGDSLPPVAEMAALFEVSVPVVREATAGLAVIGMLKRQQGRESVVSTPNSSHLGRILALRISSEQIDDESIQQFREIVEVGSARLAARNRGEVDLVRLDEAMAALRQAGTPESLHHADVAFHDAVACAAGNDLFVLTLRALTPLLQRQRERVWRGWATVGGDLNSIVEAHAIVLAAIRNADQAAAAAAMTAHLGQARHGLESPATGDDHTPFDLAATGDVERDRA